MAPFNREDVSRSISMLMPSIIQGVNLGFLSKRSITHTQFFVLIAVHSNGRCPISRLAANMHVSMPTMSGIVDRLVKAGYITRIPDPKDRRQVMIELAAKGRQFIEQFQKAVSTRWAEVLQAVEPVEVDAFGRVITKLREVLQSRGPNVTNK